MNTVSRRGLGDREVGQANPPRSAAATTAGTQAVAALHVQLDAARRAAGSG